MSGSPHQLLEATRREQPPYRKIKIANNLTGLAEEDLPPAVFDHLLQPENLWKPEGAILKPGSRSTVTRVHIDGLDYVLKQYKSLSLHRRLRYAITRTRARQSWENGQVMARLGIPVIRPLALLEESFLGIPARSALLMPFQAGTALSDFTDSDLAPIAKKLRSIFALMKEHRMTHGDMKATNIIIDQANEPHLIDIDASLIHSSLASFKKARAKDEARFFKNWANNPKATKDFAEVFT